MDINFKCTPYLQSRLPGKLEENFKMFAFLIFSHIPYLSKVFVTLKFFLSKSTTQYVTAWHFSERVALFMLFIFFLLKEGLAFFDVLIFFYLSYVACYKYSVTDAFGFRRLPSEHQQLSKWW